MEKINLGEKFGLFSEYWSPRIIGEVNESHVKIAKFKGEFIWHSHEHEDEMFLVIKGALTIHFRDRDILLREGECLVVPKGVEHKPVARRRSPCDADRAEEHFEYGRSRERQNGRAPGKNLI